MNTIFLLHFMHALSGYSPWLVPSDTLEHITWLPRIVHRHSCIQAQISFSNLGRCRFFLKWKLYFRVIHADFFCSFILKTDRRRSLPYMSITALSMFPATYLRQRQYVAQILKHFLVNILLQVEIKYVNLDIIWKCWSEIWVCYHVSHSLLSLYFAMYHIGHIFQEGRQEIARLFSCYSTFVVPWLVSSRCPRLHALFFILIKVPLKKQEFLTCNAAVDSLCHSEHLKNSAQVNFQWNQLAATHKRWPVN